MSLLMSPPPINDWFPCTCPHHMGAQIPPPPMCKLPRENPVPYVLCCFQQDKCYLPRLLASLFLHFEKFYVKLSVCFCLISVKVSEFIYFEIYLRKQLKRTQKSTQYDCTKKHCNSSCPPAANGNSVQCKC